MSNEVQDAHHWPIARVASSIRAGRFSARELTERLLQRIESVDARIHSYVTVLAQSALEQASRADEELKSGLDRGPLHGIPVAVKDNLYTKDAPTTVGSAFLAEHLPRWDATVVHRLKNAGAVLIGKLAMSEGAVSDYAPGRPAPVNPWHPDYWSGLSSSGPAVAVAAGLCYGALASDSGGSIRMPSAACGVTGLKPTWGRVSMHGLFPLCVSRDHVGPMARSVQDVSLLLQVTAGFDAQDFASIHETVDDYSSTLDMGIRGLRLGVDWNALTHGVDEELQEAFRAAVERFESLGASVHAVSYPSPDNYLRCNFAAAAAEIALTHAPYFENRQADYGPALRALITSGKSVKGSDVVQVEHERLRLQSALTRVLSEVDVLLLPVFPRRLQTIARTLEQLNDTATFISEHGRYTLPFNASGHPTLTIPCGRDCNGLPIALQLVGKHLSEAALLRSGFAFQANTPWHSARVPHE